MKVSVLLLTFNEARNLPRCLAALEGCDDILVLDSGSSDATLDIARDRGRLVISRAFDSFAEQRNYGLEHGNLRYEWVLHLDADEIVTPALLREIESLAPDSQTDAYWMPSMMMFGETWLKHAGMYPTYQVRLARRDRFRFRQVGHGQREDVAADRIGTLTEPYLHYSFSHGLVSWLQKHVRYARDEAALIAAERSGRRADASRFLSTSRVERRRALKAFASRLPLLLRPIGRFIYIYCLRRGFLDGKAGLAYALMLAVYEGMIAVLAYEALLGSPNTPSFTGSEKGGSPQARPPVARSSGPASADFGRP